MPDSESASTDPGTSEDSGPSNKGTSGKDDSPASGNEDNDPGKIEFHEVFRYEIEQIDAEFREVPQTTETDEGDSGTSEDES
jgi:hypothetical protein